MNEITKNMECLLSFLTILSVVHGDFFNAFCSFLSPSMKYSILLNTISMKIVCGHAHPHHNLPKTDVNNTIKTTKVNIVNPKRKKSCGQNIKPKIMNLRSSTFSNKIGLPFTLMNGNANIIARKK